LQDVEEEKNKVTIEKDKTSAILHSIGDGVFVVDRDLRIILLNEVASKLCGIKIEEAMGKKYHEVFRFIYEDLSEERVNDKFIKDAITTGNMQEMSNHTLLVQKAETKYLYLTVPLR